LKETSDQVSDLSHFAYSGNIRY